MAVYSGNKLLRDSNVKQVVKTIFPIVCIQTNISLLIGIWIHVPWYICPRTTAKQLKV